MLNHYLFKKLKLKERHKFNNLINKVFPERKYNKEFWQTQLLYNLCTYGLRWNVHGLLVYMPVICRVNFLGLFCIL
jgi:hypothetical protein